MGIAFLLLHGDGFRESPSVCKAMNAENLEKNQPVELVDGARCMAASGIGSCEKLNV